VRVGGPLATYAAGFEDELAGLGYKSPADHLFVVSQLSRWMAELGVGPSELSGAQIESFLRWRGEAGYVTALSPVRLTRFVAYLVELGVLGGIEPPAPQSAREVLLGRYRRYLCDERGLTEASVRVYIQVAHSFLDFLADISDLEDLDAAAVICFMLGETGRMSVASAKATATRLRSLLRFFYLDGLVATSLADAVPSSAGWRLASLPKALLGSQVASLLKTCDRRTALGRRDYAMLVLLARLGLRAGEVAHLKLGDIDWRAAELTIRGKGHRTDRLPLPIDAGEAITVWLIRGRPQCRGSEVFVGIRAPHQALTSGGVSGVVRRACQRAGLPAAGAHRLRHSAATSMLAGGAGLDEIGQVLRHERRDTTAIYAKVDRRRLQTVVRPWPGARP
jgi:site-specific recombinase XerD